ncbi:hypothetical protein EPO15_12480 [bacterium]|nr:MAG: hypothetical protein EPO15_12480 [bacterium]
MLLPIVAMALALPAAAKSPSCTAPDKHGRVPRMPDVMACQEKARAAFTEETRKKTRRDPSPEAQDRFDDFQRAEMRAYMRKHPKEATLDDDLAAEKKSEEAGGQAGVMERVGAAVGVAKEKLGLGPKPAPEAGEARQALGALRDGQLKVPFDFKAAAAEARQDPAGTLKRAVHRRNQEFEENVPEEAKKFYRKGGAQEEQGPDDEY